MAKHTGSVWQPDLFGGVGIQRPETTTQTDSLSAARQEMRDTGADDLFDATTTVTIRHEVPSSELRDEQLAARLKAEYPGQTQQTLYGRYVQARDLKPTVDAKRFGELLNQASPNLHVETRTVPFTPTHHDSRTDQPVQIVKTEYGHSITWAMGMTGSEPGPMGERYTPITTTPVAQPTSTEHCQCPATTELHRAHPESPYHPGRAYVETKPVADSRCTAPGTNHDHLACVSMIPDSETKHVPHRCNAAIGLHRAGPPCEPWIDAWLDQSGTRHLRAGSIGLYLKAPCGAVGLQSTEPALRICNKCQ